MALMMGAMTFTSCSKDDDKNNAETVFNVTETTPLVDDDNYNPNTTAANYSVKSFGEGAVDGCADIVSQLEAANAIIGSAKLSEAQIDEACRDFKAARMYWEQSEAFLGGAASDFDIDPTIDSWPLNRSALLSYFNSGMNDEMLSNATILDFHALEFILFRDGQPRKVAELKGNDTYKNFEHVSGEQELAYAQTVCTLLKQRTFQLQCAWDGGKDASRMAVVKAAGLDYQTEKGLSFGDNLINAGISGSNSSFPTLKDAIAQILSDDEGSCLAIANEVGTAKIANPFSAGDVSYVESPYSYNSIADFRDNIRSIRNVWLGSTDKTANKYSFHTFFASVKQDAIDNKVEGAYVSAIEGISNMPSPFVKYCCTIWNIAFRIRHGTLSQYFKNGIGRAFGSACLYRLFGQQ